MTDRDWIILGLLLNSALALIGIFVAGLVLGVPVAWKMAIASAALIYFLYLFQVMGWKASLMNTTQACAIAAGAIGFVALLVK